MNLRFIPTAELVVEVNKYICEEQGNPHSIIGNGKIESALHTALYPGTYPYSSGGVAKIAGAICYYLVKAHAFMDGNKRTAVIVASTFMCENGWELEYTLNEANGRTALTNIVEKCIVNEVSKEQLIEWFDSHKVVADS